MTNLEINLTPEDPNLTPPDSAAPGNTAPELPQPAVKKGTKAAKAPRKVKLEEVKVSKSKQTAREVRNTPTENVTAESESVPEAPKKIRKKPKVAEPTPEQPEAQQPLVEKLKEVVKAKVRSIRKKAPEQQVAAEQVEMARLTFQLRYNTKFGQSFSITGNHALLGNNDLSKSFPLSYLNNEIWQAEIEIPVADLANSGISYKYVLHNDDGTQTIEWGDDKVISAPDNSASTYLLVDCWNFAGYYENTFYTEPFKKVFFKNDTLAVESPLPENYTHVFRVKAPLLKTNEALCICGNVPELGGWNKEQVLLMGKQPGSDWWTVRVNLANANFPLAYKYGVYNQDDKTLVELETGNNRVLFDTPAKNKLTLVTDCFVSLPNTTFRGAGVAIPVFSLRTNSSFGVGEFNDIKQLVDWAKGVGLKLIQLLPVNDTIATISEFDSYPYAAISAFALHPIYLHLPGLVPSEDTELTAQAAKFNESPTVEYVDVLKAKFDFVKKVFATRKKEVFKSNGFNEFFATNAHWLVPYAAFSYLRDEYKTVDFSTWPQNSQYNVSAINTLAGSPAKMRDEIGIYFFIQYQLHLQLKGATEYAHANGIIVKGDIPIGIYRHSCDAWQQPELYNMDQQAGAPPDDFAVKGQNWGFPTYNWQRMAEDGFTWWKKRFGQMSYYFDAFRIDHILGFFRIWSVPMDAVEGILGHFVPALPVGESELQHINVPIDRLTKPFVNDEVIATTFGEDAEKVKAEYFTSTDEHTSLKKEFDTQRKIEQYFETTVAGNFAASVKIGLFDIISNVILFTEEGGEHPVYHFRISMDSTTSFRHLDWNIQNQLRDLYVDYFYRRQDQFWKKEALAKLPEIKRGTNMLICGEDLGMVPSTVPEVMGDLGILSLEIQRMPKNPSREFFHPDDAPYLSVVTPSTHDMSTIRGWWEEDRQVTQRFYNRELGQYGKAPNECEPWINKTILLQHLYSPAMWSIFQLQDLLGISEDLRRADPNEERINVPANPKHYWRYRMHLTLEDLIAQDEYNKQLREIVKASGR